MNCLKLICILCVLNLVACAPYPLVSHDSTPAPSSLLKIKRDCLNTPQPGCGFMNAATSSLEASIGTYQKQADARDEWTQGFQDGTFWGSLAAAAGGIAHRAGLLNSGVGVAAISTASNGRYATKGQAELIAKTINVANCYANAMAIIDDGALQTLLVSDPTQNDYYTTATTMMDGIVERFQKLHAGLTTNLRELSTTNYTTDQLTSLIEKSKPAPFKTAPNAGSKALESRSMTAWFADLKSKTKDENDAANLQIAQWAANAKAVPSRMDTCLVTTN